MKTDRNALWPKWLPMDSIYNAPARRWLQALLLVQVILTIVKFDALNKTRQDLSTSSPLWTLLLLQEIARTWIILVIAAATLDPTQNLFFKHEALIIGVWCGLDLMVVIWFWNVPSSGGLFGWFVFMSIELFLLPCLLYFIFKYGASEAKFEHFAKQIQNFVYSNQPVSDRQTQPLV